MSFETTSSIVWWTRRPLMAANMLLIIRGSLPFRPLASSREVQPGLVRLLRDHRAVDVREHLLAHVLLVDRRDDGPIPYGHDERRVVDEDERVAPALRRCSRYSA